MMFGSEKLLKAITILGVASFGYGEELSIIDLCEILPAGEELLKPHTCNTWIRCPSMNNPKIEEGICVRGLYYNKNSGTCEHESKVVCPYNQQTETNACLNQKDGVFIADKTRCNGYIYCSNGKESKSVCPSNLVFNPNKSACVYPHEYECKIATEDKYISPICRPIKEDVKLANKTDCTHYEYCANGIVSHEKCERSYAFDHVKGECVPMKDAVCVAGAKEPEPENLFCGSKELPKIGYYSDGKTCSGYYLCGDLQEDGTPDRSPKHFSCSNGLFFDEKKQSCRNRLNVKCNYDRCEGMGNKYVNVLGDCHKYGRCQNGVTVDLGTCPNSGFFDELTGSCIPVTINYEACSPSIQNPIK